jgi:homoserine dehydrogenase
MREIRIGLLGFGTVGTGMAKILLGNADLIQKRLGARLVLARVADIDTTTDRGITLPEGVLTNNAQAVVTDPAIDIIVEMIGGVGIAKKLIFEAISFGKHVVTANKALLATYGNEIFRAADKKNVDLAFEASTGGCMPVIKTIRESLAGNQVHAMVGILNGTCNYILSKISDDGSTFNDALAAAQRNGYAESDPSLDVNGHDTAHKLAILSSLAYGMTLNLADIYVEGISNITPQDIEFAATFGYRIKLLAISKFQGDRVEARVHPTMIPFDNLLSNVNGRVNALMISADAVDDVMLYGYGAGMMPTGSAVVSDCIDIARNLLCGATCRVPHLSYRMPEVQPVPIRPMDDIETLYYFRFLALDQPGVLSKIAGVLGEYAISIRSVQQQGRKTNGAVPVVMLTHRAREADVRRALETIETLEVMAQRPVVIRIEDSAVE